MKEYRFSEEQAKKVMKSRLVSRSPMILIAILGGLYIANTRNGAVTFENPLVLILTIATSFIALGIGLFIGIKNGTKTLIKHSYRISDKGIEWTNPTGRLVSIDFNEVDMHRALKRGLFIRAKKQSVLIPSGLDQYDELSALILKKMK